MTRPTAVLAVFAAAALALVATPASRSADECRGLPVCIPVEGPWVVIPAGPRSGPAPSASWQLVCPQGVVGGLDARLTSRAIDVGFAGLVGSPVSPGVTTERAVVVTGRYGGRARRPVAFKPFIGCIPAAGGGRVPTGRTAFAPGRPAVTRVRTVALVPGRTVRAAFRCRPGERLLAWSQAVGLDAPRQPSPRQLAGVHSRVSRRQHLVVAWARASLALAGVSARMQIHLLCTRGRPLP